MAASPRPRFRCQGCGRISAWREGAICSSCRIAEARAAVNALAVRAETPTGRPVSPFSLDVHERWLRRLEQDGAITAAERERYDQLWREAS